jgi:hypothetical protein
MKIIVLQMNNKIKKIQITFQVIENKMKTQTIKH